MASPKPRRTAPRARKPRVEEPTPAPTVAPAPSGGSGKKIVLGFLALALLSVLLWAVLHRADAGPKVPLPREGAACHLGESYLTVLNQYPRLKTHPFNNDEEFQIASLKDDDGLPEGVTGADLIFYKNTLFFISTQTESAALLNPDTLAQQFRRWVKPGSGTLQNMGGNATLREWNFRDDATEMILRELKYNDKAQYWQDLRDGANADGQKAFEKYRIDS